MSLGAERNINQNEQLEPYEVAVESLEVGDPIAVVAPFSSNIVSGEVWSVPHLHEPTGLMTSLIYRHEDDERAGHTALRVIAYSNIATRFNEDGKTVIFADQSHLYPQFADFKEKGAVAVAAAFNKDNVIPLRPEMS